MPEKILSLAHLSQEEVTVKMQRPLILELAREGRVAYGKAADLLGVSQAEFLANTAQHQVSPIQLAPDGHARELEPTE